MRAEVRVAALGVSRVTLTRRAAPPFAVENATPQRLLFRQAGAELAAFSEVAPCAVGRCRLTPA